MVYIFYYIDDNQIAITTDIGLRYATSQERVCVYEYERDKSFVVCLSGCRANLIDGYYRIRGVRTNKIVYITYTKVQSLNGMLMRNLSGRKQYNQINDAGAKFTPTFLAEKCIAGTNATYTVTNVSD